MPRLVSLSWNGIFWRKPSIAEPGSEEDDDRHRSSTALDRAPVRAGVDQSLVILPCADNGERRDAAVDAPWYGSRQMARHLRRNGWCVGRHRVRRLMTKM